ncbi:MAG: HEAT repeat domain-containing protein [Planctomycetes bacterium]|nr:HEAT repeat domain-containing protein [Planctomycetota bacterium]
MSDRNDAAGITLHFCALCNESIPKVDVDSGRAKRHKDRLVCGTCDRAMSATHAAAAAEAAGSAQAGGPAQPVGPAEGAGSWGTAAPSAHGEAVHRPAEASSGAGAILVGVLALLVAIGGVLWGRWQREQDLKQADVRQTEARAEWSRTLGESQRALDNERAARQALENTLVDARAEWQRVANESRRASVADASKLAGELEGLRGTLASLDQRLAAAVSHEEFSSLRGAADEARLELSSLAKKVLDLEERQRAPQVQPIAPNPAAAAQPSWFGIVQRLKSPDFSTRWTAVQELGETGDPEVVDYLVPILQDPDVFVRLATARELGNLGSTKAVDGLIAALGDENSTVREEAYVALRKLTKKDLPFDAQSNDSAERQRRIKAWQDWWKKAREDASAP